MRTMWRQHGDNMGTTGMWRPCGDNMETTWGQCGDHRDVETTWGQHEDNVETTWGQVKSLTRKPVGLMQSCCFVFNGNETNRCLLCNSYLFGMNNVLYIE